MNQTHQAVVATPEAVVSAARLEKSTETSLYLDLMKRCVTNLIYMDVEYSPIMPRDPVRRMAIKLFDKAGLRLCRAKRPTMEARLRGTDLSNIPHTMISWSRLDNLQESMERVLAEGIPGDFIETGIMRGGSVIFMRAVLKAYGVTNRTVWAADSFAGMPAPNPEKYPADAGTMWHTLPVGEVSLEHIQRNFSRYDLLDDQVRFLKGWFRDTLPTAPIERLALLRLDGDLYESTMDALVPLYPKLSVGGYCIVDDYNLECCKLAIEDYRREHGIDEEIIPIDGAGVYWRKRRS
jgi:O-methyltransferase